MRKLFCGVLMAMILMFSVTTSGFASGIELTDGVETGMELEEVKQEINLKHTTSQRDLVAYQRYNDEGEAYSSYYFFNDKTDELIYKLLFVDGDVEERIENLKESSDSVVEEGGTYFFSKEGYDLGFKVMDNEAGDNEYQLWVGSISLWDELADDESNTLNEFQME